MITLQKLLIPFLTSLVLMVALSIQDADELGSPQLDLFIVAGQSNAQGAKGDGCYYPEDPEGVDKSIRFYWETPKISSSRGKWTSLQAQGGIFKKGHFGPEVTFARFLKMDKLNPAIFKYSRGSTSLCNDWGGPSDGKMYDQMVAVLVSAVRALRRAGYKVNIRGFVWIQGESDANNEVMAQAYKERLRLLIDDLRGNVVKNSNLPIILGVDEQHPWVKRNPQVVQAQKDLARDKFIAFTTMKGLEKADSSHLTPKGLEAHGKRLFGAYKKIITE